MCSVGLEAEAGEIQRALGISPTDIVAIISAITAIAEVIKKCREDKQARRSWGSLKEEGATENGFNRAHRAVIRKLGIKKAKAIGGRSTTRYIVNRYRTQKASVLESLVAEATR